MFQQLCQSYIEEVRSKNITLTLREIFTSADTGFDEYFYSHRLGSHLERNYQPLTFGTKINFADILSIQGTIELRMQSKMEVGVIKGYLLIMNL